MNSTLATAREAFVFRPHSPHPPGFIDDTTVYHSICNACRLGDVKILERLWLRHNAQEVYVRHSPDILVTVACTEHVHVLRWLINVTGMAPQPMHRKRMFMVACSMGCYRMSKELYVPSIDYDRMMLLSACEAGHAELVKWLCGVFGPKVELTHECFVRACTSNSIVLASWILSVADIDVSAHSFEAFRRTCARGHVIMAEWLLSVHPHDNCDMESLLQMACGASYLHIVWLLCIHFGSTFRHESVQNAFSIATKADSGLIVAYLWEAFNRTLDLQKSSTSVY